MKRLALLSLVLNCALLLLAAARSRQVPAAASVVPSRTNTLERTASAPSITTRASLPPEPQHPKPWAAIETRDPKQFIANLRALGCPELTIRDIMTLRVNRAYRVKMLEMETDFARAWDFTRNRSRREVLEFNYRRKQLYNARDTELESLLGVSSDALVATALGMPERVYPMDYISLEKRARVREVNARIQQLVDEAGLEVPAPSSNPESRARRRELDQQKEAALIVILTPQELEEYQLRESRYASFVRNYQGGARSEAEFRAMVKVAIELGMDTPPDPFRARYRLPPDDPAEAKAEEERNAAFQRRVKEVLGQQ